MEVKHKRNVLVSQIWNAVIISISMHREPLLSIEHVQRGYYDINSLSLSMTQTDAGYFAPPPFFTNQDTGGEAERRTYLFLCFVFNHCPS